MKLEPVISLHNFKDQNQRLTLFGHFYVLWEIYISQYSLKIVTPVKDKHIFNPRVVFCFSVSDNVYGSVCVPLDWAACPPPPQSGSPRSLPSRTSREITVRVTYGERHSLIRCLMVVHDH